MHLPTHPTGSYIGVGPTVWAKTLLLPMGAGLGVRREGGVLGSGVPPSPPNGKVQQTVLVGSRGSKHLISG